MTATLTPISPAVATGPASLPAPAVWLDHVMLVLDAETHRAVLESPLVCGELAAVEHQTAPPGGAVASGVYLYGEHTYLELFAASRNVGMAGAAGLAFCVEEMGGAARVAERLRVTTGAPVASGLRTLDVGGERIPWFSWASVRYADPLPRLGTWVMEYHPAYAARVRARAPAAACGAAPLTRREAVSRRFASERLLGDVRGVTLALSAAARERIVREFAAFGYPATHTSARSVIAAPGLTIEIVSANDDRDGVVAVHLTLRRAKRGCRHVPIGPHSAMTFRDDRTATWALSAPCVAARRNARSFDSKRGSTE